MIGKKSHHLEIIKDLGTFRYRGKMRRRVVVKCDCGNTKEVWHIAFNAGYVKSCGCANKNFKHGLTGTSFYYRYHYMIARCYDKNNPNYKSYGALGVTVCDRWRYSFNNFKLDMYESYLLHKKNNNTTQLDKDIICAEKGIYPPIYSPETCKWVTSKENMSQHKYHTKGRKEIGKKIKQNKHKIKGILKRKVFKIKYKGSYYTQRQIADFLGISFQAVSYRLKKRGRLEK